MTDYFDYNPIKPVADLNAMRLNLVGKVTKRIAKSKFLVENLERDSWANTIEGIYQ